ncbi:major egg antigen-like [Tropilaelaps mercedesae]|uniref:Major egg antigen-like n=1 Tax=Tropilaelaps mercedesae TaxID=418985 RepID=A0A1V9XWL6_9ACAR|nr:major egg antigen-like [Tropilaelaps mercedesae]
MFEDCCRNDMKSWFEKHIQSMEEDLCSRNLRHLIKVDPQRRRRVFEEMFMSSSPCSQSPHDDSKVLCDLALSAERFGPEDIEITLKGKELTVHARKEVKFESGFSLREVKNTVKIGEEFDLEKLSAHLTDSRIIIKAPLVKVTPEKRTGNVEIKVKRIVNDDIESSKADLKRNEDSSGDIESSSRNKDVSTNQLDRTVNVQVDKDVNTRNAQMCHEIDSKNGEQTRHTSLRKSYETKNCEIKKSDENEYVLKRTFKMKSHSEAKEENVEL